MWNLWNQVRKGQKIPRAELLQELENQNCVYFMIYDGPKVGLTFKNDQLFSAIKIKNDFSQKIPQGIFCSYSSFSDLKES